MDYPRKEKRITLCVTCEVSLSVMSRYQPNVAQILKEKFTANANSTTFTTDGWRFFFDFFSCFLRPKKVLSSQTYLSNTKCVYLLKNIIYAEYVWKPQWSWQQNPEIFRIFTLDKKQICQEDRFETRQSTRRWAIV